MGETAVDVRAVIAADLEILIQAHQPDEDGHCAICRACGDLSRYPCPARLLCEQAAAALNLRRERDPDVVMSSTTIDVA